MMLNDIKNAVLAKMAKHKLTHVLMSNDKTRLFVEMDVNIIGFGLQKVVAHIFIKGNNADILKNEWVLVRLNILNSHRTSDERIILSEKTKKEIWEFITKELGKVEKKRVSR